MSKEFSDFSFYTTQPESVDLDLARSLQTIGAEAWALAMPNRSNEEIAHMFNPDSEQQVANAVQQYNDFARHGALVTAVVLNESHELTPVGYAMARNDVSGNLFSRMIKQTVQRDKVYAWLTQINVSPEFQGRGIGSQLLRKALGNFKPTQVPTAYIFDENELAKGWFARKGFKRTPARQQPREDIAYNYFGAENPRVNQYRYAAQSVQAVVHPIRQRS